MKKDLHPRGYLLTLVDTRGEEHVVTVYFKPEHSKISLEMDKHNHQAWRERTEATVKISEVERYKRKYSDLGV